MLIIDFTGCTAVFLNNLQLLFADKYPGDVKRQRNGSAVSEYIFILSSFYCKFATCSSEMKNLYFFLL